MSSKIETVTVPEDASIAGYGILASGTYTIEMPSDYDPALVTAEDIVLDGAMRIVDEGETIRYYAAAYTGTTRIPGDDGPMRETPIEAHDDCRPACHGVEAVEDGDCRPLTDQEQEWLSHDLRARDNEN